MPAFALPSPLVSPEQLAALLATAAAPLVVDCSFDLADPGAGERAFEQGHLPGEEKVSSHQVKRAYQPQKGDDPFRQSECTHNEHACQQQYAKNNRREVKQPAHPQCKANVKNHVTGGSTCIQLRYTGKYPQHDQVHQQSRGKYIPAFQHGSKQQEAHCRQVGSPWKQAVMIDDTGEKQRLQE